VRRPGFIALPVWGSGDSQLRDSAGITPASLPDRNLAGHPTRGRGRTPETDRSAPSRHVEVAAIQAGDIATYNQMLDQLQAIADAHNALETQLQAIIGPG